MDKLIIGGRELDTLRRLVADFNRAAEAYGAAGETQLVDDTADTRAAVLAAARGFERAKTELAHYAAGLVRRG